MLKESQKPEEQINSIHMQLNDFPRGNFFCSRNGKYNKWYISDGQKQTYLPKSERMLAERMAEKKYLTLLSEDLQHEKRAIDFYLRHHSKNVGQARHLLTNNPEYQELLAPSFAPVSQELLDWMNSPYEKNNKHSDQLIHKTSSGHFVRSKSEAIIDMFLHINKIPFRYECSLQLGNSVIYPDFTIRHPETGDTFYWEHFGLMDDPIYSKNTFSKLQLYTSHGIIPTIHLITTYETRENPLSSEMVEKIIEHYFL